MSLTDHDRKKLKTALLANVLDACDELTYDILADAGLDTMTVGPEISAEAKAVLDGLIAKISEAWTNG